MINYDFNEKIPYYTWNQNNTKAFLKSNTILVGATQSGKSSLMDMMVNEIEDGKSVIFEVKGDRIKMIKSDDIYVSCTNISEGLLGRSFNWSILKEAEVSSSTSIDIEKRIADIYEPVFKSDINNSSQPYFLKAACHLLVGLTYALYKKMGLISNYLVFKVLQEMDVSDYLRLLSEANIIKKYSRDIPIINGRISGQAAGVLGELSHYIDIFSRIFSKETSRLDSILEFCKTNESNRMFLLYDFTAREESDCLFSVLLNLLISYKLGLSYRNVGLGRIFLFLDEISVIQDSELDLQYAVNIGTSKGLHVVLAIQSIQFLQDIYGTENANAILEGFSNFVAFKVNQKESKDYIRNRIGQEKDELAVAFPLTRREKPTYCIRKDNIITDELIEALDVGMAIIKIGLSTPCIVKFNRNVVRK